ncbi:cation:proton antiporter [Flavihumibacter sp. ZG627]|uniref:cation:proton antiporter n=1 Tax=Flavihumibacter sp. ZG627 TaxID=1463156 RepID=UPI00057F1BA7|nr:cation:proton antiporter [Flavihumibacter sp. ZG627]KIC92282.1 sodium:proton antiporter [Flavihumibacter sp. ZG627]
MNENFLKELLEEFHRPLTNPVLIFSLILLIILLSPILLRKINIPGIIGLIISGVVIGPHGFNILAKNSAVDLFSTIGLLYIMFIAGLELDLNEFQKHKNKSFVFGALTFFIPLTLGYPVCYYVLGYGPEASFLTASMFATHTLVAYPIVTRFGIAKHSAVAITVGGTILTDTAVLIILAIIMGSSKGNLNQEFWIRLGTSLAIFSAIMFLLVPRIAKWFFRKLESEKTSHYIFVLSVVFFAAFLAEVAGVEAIIGAFVAGLALNKLIPHSSALMNRIEFIGNAIFIPFFLISVGMLVDVSVIFSGYTALVVAGVLTITALLGKWLAAFATQKIFRYKRQERQLIFGLSSAHAAATLAIILVGFREGILDENILNGTIILILITCLVASFATENATRQIVMDSETNLVNAQESPLNEEHILLPVEDFKRVEQMLELAILLKDKKSPNPITLLSVVPNNEEAEQNLQVARKKLEKTYQIASATETNINIIASIDHNINSGIIRTSKEIMASLILLDWPVKKNLVDIFFGERTDQLLSHIDKNVFITRTNNLLAAHKRILLFLPPMVELEKGFSSCLDLLLRLSKELTVPVICYCNTKTQASVNNYIISVKSGLISFTNFDEWDDFLVLSRSIRQEDIMVIFTGRRGSVSFQPAIDNIYQKLEKYFEQNSRLLVYPSQYDSGNKFEEYDDINAEPLSKGIETIQKIGKEIGSIFKGKD